MKGKAFWVVVLAWSCTPVPPPAIKDQPAPAQKPPLSGILMTPAPSRRTMATAPFVCGVDAEAIHQPVVIADLRLRSGNENRVPNAEDVRRIEATRARVLHRFNVAVVRVRLDTASLRDLVSPSGVADYATLVADTSDYTVNTQIFFSRPITPADVQELQRLGVKTFGIPFRPNILYAVAVDRAIPTIAKLTGVDFVRARGRMRYVGVVFVNFCLTDVAADKHFSDAATPQW